MPETPEEAYRDLMEGTLEIAEACWKERRPYIHEVLGKDFVVLPGVFSPKYFRDTEFFAREVPKHAGKSFLEIGTGTGIVACFAAMSGSEVVATDINLESLRNARINALLHDLEGDVDVRVGSIYEPVSNWMYNSLSYWNNSRFHTIFWNVPFGDWVPKNSNYLTDAVFDPGHKNLRRFILEAPKYLKGKNSNLLIGYSTTLGQYHVLEQLLEEAGFTPPEMVAESGYVREGNPRRPVDFKLFEARIR